MIIKGSSTKTITKVIEPSLSEKELISFKNILMYDFSPQETKLLVLTSDTTLWQTLGITKRSTKHEEPTGIIKKKDDIFTYLIFDLSTNQIIDRFENATNITFNNEAEITIHYEDGTITTQNLPGYRSTTDSIPPAQIVRYNPYEKIITISLEDKDSTFF